MNKIFVCIVIIMIFSSNAYAGFLSGNSTPNVEVPGQYAFKMSTTLLMTDTPFSAICLSGKYAVNDVISLSGKAGVGTIDYSTISNTKLTTDPQLYAFGLDYVISGDKKVRYYALAAEYETVSWGINKQSNTSNEILIGIDYGIYPSENLKTRYRVALHNFNAGEQSQEQIGSSTKYSASTELEYSFTKNFKGSFEVGIFFGDPVGGLLSYFGLGFGFTS